MKIKFEIFLKARYITEAYYPDEMVNVILVKKIQWTMENVCSFTNLNKDYLKDSLPLSRID